MQLCTASPASPAQFRPVLCSIGCICIDFDARLWSMQSAMLAVVEALAVKQDSMAVKLDKLTDHMQQILTKQASMMLL